jgi:hypothetical protein
LPPERAVPRFDRDVLDFVLLRALVPDRLALDLVLLRDEADFFAADFLADDFFADDFLADDFFAADFLADDFFADDFLADDFFAADFLADDFFAADFLADDFFADDFFVLDFLAADFEREVFVFERDVFVFERDEVRRREAERDEADREDAGTARAVSAASSSIGSSGSGSHAGTPASPSLRSSKLLPAEPPVVPDAQPVSNGWSSPAPPGDSSPHDDPGVSDCSSERSSESLQSWVIEDLLLRIPRREFPHTYVCNARIGRVAHRENDTKAVSRTCRTIAIRLS